MREEKNSNRLILQLGIFKRVLNTTIVSFKTPKLIFILKRISSSF